MDRDKFCSLTQNMGNIFSYISGTDNYELVYINKNLMNHLGLNDNRYIGSYCYEVVYGFSQPCYFCTKNKLKLGQTQRYYKYNPKLQSYFVSRTSVIQTDIGYTHMCVSYDISSQYKKINQLKEDLSVETAIAECAKTMFYNENISVSIKMLLETVCNFYQSERSYVFLVDETTLTFNTLYKFSSPNYIETSKSINAFPLSSFENAIHMTLENKLSCVNLNRVMLPSKSKELSFLFEYEIDNLLLASLVKYGKIIGFVGIVDPLRNYDTQKLIETISTFIVNDLTKYHVRLELENSIDLLNKNLHLNKTMAKCAKDLVLDTDYDICVKNLLETVCKFYQACRVDIFQVDELGDNLINSYYYTASNKSFADNCYDDLNFNHFKKWFEKFEEHYIVYIDAIKENFTENIKVFDYNFISGGDSYLIIGLKIKNNLVGFLGIINPLNVEKSNTALPKTISAFISNYLQKSSIISKLQELSFLDKLTGLLNRNGYLHTLEQLKLQPQENFGIIFADVNGLKRANDNLGHEYGDVLIRWCGNFLKRHLDCDVFRIGGDEFVVFVKGFTSEEFFDKIQYMRGILFNMNVLNMSMGGTYQVLTEDIDKQIVDTDKIMYLEKQKYYILKQVTGMDFADDILQLKTRIEELKNDLNL